MQFDEVQEFTCPTELQELEVASCPIDKGPGPGTNPDCSDPAYAAAHPEECGTQPPAMRLILKPAVANICAMKQNIQFRTFVFQNEMEQEITSGLEYKTADFTILTIGGVSGNATGLAAGTATVSVQWQELSAFAQVTVQEQCCDDVKVAMMLVLDVSKSMGQGFSPNYSNKLTYAKLLARRFAEEVATEKGDRIGLITFHSGTTIVEELTDDLEQVDMAIASVGQTTSPTDINGALSTAVTYLNEQTGFQRKVIVLLSDGENRPPGQTDPLPIAAQFRSTGGVIIVAGIRSNDGGFTLLNNIATGGFFLNAYAATESIAFEWLSGLKGYVCAGNCQPPGGECVHHAQLDYNSFQQWDVVEGHVDLIGGTPPYALHDILPGNDLYVDLAGTMFPSKGKIRTNADVVLVTGNNYELTYFLAGNQRQTTAGDKVRVRVEPDLVDVTVTITDWKMPFTQYTNAFTPTTDAAIRISFQQVVTPAFPLHGTPIDVIQLRNMTTGDIVFYEDFSDENTVCLPLACGPTEPPVTGTDIISIDFKGVDEITTMTGPAAIGQAGDFWNTKKEATDVPSFGGDGFINLKWVTGQLVDTVIPGGNSHAVLSNQEFGWHSQASGSHPDPMMNRYLVGNDYTPNADLSLCDDAAFAGVPINGCRFSFFDSLPSGVYDFYIYGHGEMDFENSRFVMSVAGDYKAAKQTAEGMGFLGAYTEGQQYVVFRDLVVNFHDQVRLYVLSASGNSLGLMHGFLNGIQIHRKNAPGGAGGGVSVAPENAYANCYGTGCLASPVPAQVVDPVPLPDIEV